MALIFTGLTFTALLWVASGDLSDEFVRVECESKHVTQLGQKTLLKCVVQVSQAVGDPIIQMVAWKKQGEEKPLLAYNRGTTEQKPGYRLADPFWNEKNMDVSLVIDNTSLSDAGTISCLVLTDSSDAEGTTNLEVTARYNKPVIHSIPEKITGGSDSVLICDAYGGYPAGQIRWFDHDNADWTKSSKMTAKQTPNGLFKLSSRLSLLPGSTFPKYTCAVFNAVGEKEDETVFEVLKKEESTGTKDSNTATNIVAPVVVIGSIIVGILIIMMLVRFCKRSNRNSHNPVCTYSDAERGCADNIDEKQPALPE